MYRHQRVAAPEKAQPPRQRVRKEVYGWIKIGLDARDGHVIESAPLQQRSRRGDVIVEPIVVGVDTRICAPCDAYDDGAGIPDQASATVQESVRIGRQQRPSRPIVLNRSTPQHKWRLPALST